MNDVLRHMYDACDPQRPATEAQYLDCSDARGGSPFVEYVKTRLDLEQGHARFLFAGHIGCGKSSELEKLGRDLEHGPIGDPCFFPILVPTGEYLDPYDAETVDILLAIVAELALALRTKHGLDLKEGYLPKRLVELKGLFGREIEISDTEPEVAGIKLPIRLLRKDPDARQRVRKALEPGGTSVLEEVNQVLIEAKNQLATKLDKEGGPHLRDFVLILDDLEKIRRFGGKPEGLDSQRELFIQRAPQLTALHAHVVYATPLELVRDSGIPLLSLYGRAPVVLPMVKVFHRGRQRKPCEEGRECLKHVLTRRAEPHALDKVFEPEVLDYLIDASGGHVRHLLQFVREAIAYASSENDTRAVSADAARRAIGQTISTFSTMIPEAHWPKLAALERSDDCGIPNGDPDYLKMLENLSVLEYVNGNGEVDSFEPWYAVHPVVRMLERFGREMAGPAKRRAKSSSTKRARKRK